VQRIDVLVGDGQGVAGAPSHDVPTGGPLRPVGLQSAAEADHVGLQRLPSGDWWITAPQRFGQPISADCRGSAGGEHGEEQSFLCAGHQHRCAVVRPDLQRSEDRDTHGQKLRLRAARSTASPRGVSDGPNGCSEHVCGQPGRDADRLRAGEAARRALRSAVTACSATPAEPAGYFTSLQVRP
jgi:hypothetical protein